MPIHSAFLRYFDEVCKSGSIRKAAGKLHITSSAVNRQILKIEDELGVNLFDRSHEGIKLTEAGHLLSKHVTRTLNDSERTMRKISSSQDAKAPTLTLAGQESVIARFMPQILMNLYSAFPDLSTSFVAASGRDLNMYLLNGTADIAMMFDASPEPGIEIVEQIKLPVGAVMAATHPLASHKRLCITECLSYSLVLPDKSWPLMDQLTIEFDNAQVDMNTFTTSNSIEFLRSLIAEQNLIGFQTVVGIEAAIEEKKLIHVPLLKTNGDQMFQLFSVAISENSNRSNIIDTTLSLLKDRLNIYKV